MTPKEFVKYLSDQALVDLSQFTIDWVETTVSNYHQQIEFMETVQPNEYFSSLKYEIENILQIMKEDLTDVLWFKLILERCQSLP